MYTPNFLEAVGVKLSKAPWSIHIEWSTTEPKNWVLARNSLLPEDLLLTLSLNDRSWELTLNRRDELFHIRWGTYGFEATSQQLKYRRLIHWPELDSPEDIVGAIDALEKLLDVRFVKYVNLQGKLCNSIKNPELFSKWLNIPVTGFGVFS